MSTFGDFFRGCTGRGPFPWQEDLAERLRGGRPPEVIAVPTGLGKTSVLVAWAWALASGEPRPGRRVPMRLLHVSPRRIIVDDTAASARQIAARLEDPDSAADQGTPLDPAARAALHWARRRLQAFTAGQGPALLAARLRGGILPDRRWQARVDQPSILVSTADLAGSALLFRHYLASASARPILAGLTGVDACWIIDESHLQAPLLTTLRRCDIGGAGELGLPSWLIETTATPPDGGRDVLTLTDRDREHEEVARRLRVTRQVRLHPDAAAAALPGRLADLAVEASRAGRRAILVVANTVDDARNTAGKIARQDKPAYAAGQVLLVHGQQREPDRAQAMLSAREALGMHRREPDRGGAAWYLVTTQAIEVGADLSADHLVTALCPGDSLIQRLGRLGRRADQGRYLCDVVPARDRTAAGGGPGGDYQTRSRDLAAYLRKRGRPPGPDQVDVAAVDVCPESDAERQIAAFSAPRPAAAPLWSSGMLALIQTRPAPLDTPDVGVLIGGLDQEDATVFLAWRADLAEDGEQGWAELVHGWPVRPHEVIEIRQRTVAGWLDGKHYLRAGGRGIQVARGPMSAGDTVVVPAAYGGHDGSGFNPGSAQPAEDVADVALDHPKGPRLRLHPGLLPAHAARIEACRDVLTDETAGERACAGAVAALLGDIAAADTTLTGRVAGALVERDLDWELRDGGVAVTTRARSLDDDDALCLTGPVTLDDHQADVAERATGMARRAGVAEDLVTAVGLGAFHHDDGKRAEPFQRALGDGELPSIPLAKSGLPRRQWRRAAQAAGLPPGFRHEALSAAVAAAAGELPAHLAGASHGHGRPWFPPAETPGGLSTTAGAGLGSVLVEGNPLQGRGFGHLMGQFLHLTSEHGPWGLAWLEAVVRLADQMASADPRTGVAPPRLVTAHQPPSGTRRPHASSPPPAALALSAIPHRTAAGWLATLGLFGCYTSLVEDPRAVWLSWQDAPAGPVPRLHGPLTRDDLLDRLALQAPVSRAWNRPEWRSQSIPAEDTGEAAGAATLAQNQPLLAYQPCTPQNFLSLFCTPRRPGPGKEKRPAAIRLSGLLTGVSSQVNLRKLAPKLASSVTRPELSATFFERWRPSQGQGSLGLDWATVADGADAAGVPLGLGCRDWYALLGATWHAAMTIPGRRLVWPIWSSPLTWDTVLHLTGRPELISALDHDQRRAQPARRQLTAWSVSRLVVSSAVKRTMHESSQYAVWIDGDDIDLRAPR